MSNKAARMMVNGLLQTLAGTELERVQTVLREIGLAIHYRKLDEAYELLEAEHLLEFDILRPFFEALMYGELQSNSILVASQLDGDDDGDTDQAI